MRWWPVLLLLPLSGCVSSPPVLLAGWSAPPGDAAPVAVQDCAELLDHLQERALGEASSLLAQSVERRHGGVVLAAEDREFMATADAAAPSGSAGHGAADAQVTGTNNQEAAADESDVLKTDGRWTYVLQGGKLYVLESASPGQLERRAAVDVGGYGGDLLLQARSDGDRLLVVTSHDSDDADVEMAGWSATRVRTYSLLDRAAPALLDERWIEGEHMGARLVDGVAHVIVHAPATDIGLRVDAWPTEEDLAARNLDWQSYDRLPERSKKAIRQSIAREAQVENAQAVAATDLQDHMPTVARLTSTGLAVTPTGCTSVMLVPEATARGTNTVLSIDLAGAGTATTQVMGPRPIVYSSADALVLAGSSRDLWWLWQNQDIDETTDVQWFDLDGLSVTPRASGRVPGTVLDSFSIDEQDGRLRIATTTGQWARWWEEAPEPMLSHLVVLEEQAGLLVPTGLVSGIAPGERIWSARFTEERAYIITFEQIDPLWVIDLTDPTAPTILGELEIPGVSTYLHPLSDELVLAIGLGPGPDGQGLDWGRVQVSLFDVSDPTAPRRADVLDLSPPESWAHSLAVDEHKAFTYWDALGLLAVPMSSYEGDIGLRLVEVDPEAKDLRLGGFVDQSSLTDSAEVRYYGGGVLRSYFYGMPGTPMVSLYAMSPAGMTAHHLPSLDEQAAVAFEPQEYGYSHCRFGRAAIC